VDILKIIKDYRRLEFRLAVFVAILAIIILSIQYQVACCAAAFMVIAIVDGVWIFAMKNNEEYDPY
jgi:hypothetical protein